jgi:hypothetical protein
LYISFNLRLSLDCPQRKMEFNNKKQSSFFILIDMFEAYSGSTTSSEV